MGVRVRPCASLLVLLLALAACGGVSAPPADGPVATLALVAPESPIGLSYGEQAMLLLRYRQYGQPQAGVTLRLVTDGTAGGATLSTASVVTNDRGEASALLTSGASEAAFHVVVSAPLASDLVIDVAVSRYAFGSMAVDIDGSPYSGASGVRAGLFTDVDCALLPPTPKLLGALRSLARAERRTLLMFNTLLRRGYSVVGRAEDNAGHLLAYGCVEVSEQILSAGLQVPVTVPLRPIYPDPVGSYSLRSDLRLPVAALAPWATLACPSGLGQTLVDAVVAALTPADRDLATRLTSARGAIDARGCRIPAAMDPDQGAQSLLGVGPMGSTLAAVATDTYSIMGAAVLASRLDVRGATGQGFLADHMVSTLTLSTPATPVTYPLTDVYSPIARDLILTQDAQELELPEHGLSLQLPRLWRKAQQDLVLQPRRLMMTPSQIWQQAIMAARSGMLTGCTALEAAICASLAQPCKGPVETACTLATAAVGAKMASSLDDSTKPIDLRYATTIVMDDPDGTLQARGLSLGQLGGTIELHDGAAQLSGQVAGTRLN